MVDAGIGDQERREKILRVRVVGNPAIVVELHTLTRVVFEILRGFPLLQIDRNIQIVVQVGADNLRRLRIRRVVLDVAEGQCRKAFAVRVARFRQKLLGLRGIVRKGGWFRAPSGQFGWKEAAGRFRRIK